MIGSKLVRATNNILGGYALRDRGFNDPEFARRVGRIPQSYSVKAERYREGNAVPCAAHRKLRTAAVCRLIEVEEKVLIAFHCLTRQQRTMCLPVWTAGHGNRANSPQLTGPYVTSRDDAGDAPWEQSSRSPTQQTPHSALKQMLTKTPAPNLKGRTTQQRE
jgi:hypothetical protein